MGNYAAILFGMWLDAHNIISFAPQTFIDKKNRLWYRDKRWSCQIAKVHKARLCPEYYDLKNVFNRLGEYKTRISVYYSYNDRLDRIHSERIGRYDGVSLYRFKAGGHEVVKELRKSGELVLIFTRLFRK